MATTNKQKLEKLLKKKRDLQIKLAEMSVNKEMYGKSFDGTLHDYYSTRDTRRNKHRNVLQSQINNIKKEIDNCDVKIKKLKEVVYQ